MFRPRALVAALAVLAVACSAPPTEERRQAEGAIAAARAAGAGTYAPAELAAAEAALAEYDAAVTLGDYRQALRLALDARDGAYAAAARSGAEHALTDLERLVQSGTARLTGPGTSRLDPAAATRVRAGLKAATATMQKARSAMGAGDYQSVIATVAPIAAGLQRDLAPSDPALAGRVP